MSGIFTLNNSLVEEQADLAGFDLNLLIVLSSLLKWHNITHAGSELNLSQPATSRALKRLRELFNDELLIRSNRSFGLTPFAEALAPKVRIALENIEKVFSDRIIVPERFTVAMPDHIALLLVSQLTAFFRELSPSTVFLPIARLADTLEGMENGGVDLALGTTEDAPPGFFCRALPPIPTTCLVRKNHPVFKNAVAYPDLGRFLSIRVGSSFNTGFGEIYDGIESLRPRGRETITSPDIHTAARLVQDTDGLLVLPVPSAKMLAARFGLETYLPPLGPQMPEYQISIIWHERWHRDILHGAVRSVLASQILLGTSAAN